MARGNPATPHTLIDSLLARRQIVNDAALARLLQVAPPVLSKVRTKRLPLGPCLILRIHETFDMPVKEIRALAAA